MSNVIVNDANLSAIGNAIRGKNGTTNTYKPSEMAAAITAIQTGGGGGIEIEPIVLTGSCGYGCAGVLSSKFIELFGDKVSTDEVTATPNMFYKYTNDTIPFDINIASNCKEMANMFNMSKLKILPLIKGELTPPTGNYSGTLNMNNMFNGCNYLREIPYDYFSSFGGDAFWEASRNYYGSRSFLFGNCFSLRKLPDLSKLPSGANYNSNLYYYMAFSCYSLDEITNLPVIDYLTFTNNAFPNTISSCYRLKDFTFKTDEAGNALTVRWKSQTIDTSDYTGYAFTKEMFNGLDNGITADKEVKDDATYQALKDDNDWFTANIAYSRYNHDSAVRTINSLPDTSAYLATAGGTNTIKFKGAAGSATDGGAINTLTEEEIAVAAAKGWTVTLV